MAGASQRLCEDKGGWPGEVGGGPDPDRTDVRSSRAGAVIAVVFAAARGLEGRVGDVGM